MSASAASVLGERLRALHRQAGVGSNTPSPRSSSADPLPAPARPSTGPVPEHIRRLLGIRARATGQLPPRVVHHVDREVPGIELAPGLRLVERLFPCEAPAPLLDLRFAKQADAVDPARLLHFDTETTGLAGGTGTRAFMIGAADWRAGGLRLRQLYITTMAAEAAMLECFATWLDRDATLVSYNGRCYDAPLLATRYRLARMDNPLAGLAHADLLFPVRRRFRGAWENCRLATVERRWLGVLREDDLPGSEAPRAWLDYLRGGSARDLRRVVAHNDRDLVTLGELCLKLAGADANG